MPWPRLATRARRAARKRGRCFSGPMFRRIQVVWARRREPALHIARFVDDRWQAESRCFGIEARSKYFVRRMTRRSHARRAHNENLAPLSSCRNASRELDRVASNLQRPFPMVGLPCKASSARGWTGSRHLASCHPCPLSSATPISQIYSLHCRTASRLSKFERSRSPCERLTGMRLAPLGARAPNRVTAADSRAGAADNRVTAADDGASTAGNRAPRSSDEPRRPVAGVGAVPLPDVESSAARCPPDLIRQRSVSPLKPLY